jgi:hypothetical protein
MHDFSVGPLGFRFDGDTGCLRCLRVQGREVLRGIYPAVRDDDWATLLPKAEPVEINSGPDCLRLRLKARVTAAEMDLAWTAEIEAHARGQLMYRWRGNPLRRSTTHRTGLCVLHPAEAAGAPCVVEHTDGTREAGWFPTQISPHQPFRDIRAVTQVVGEGCEVVIRMEGEIFEMEDQRNWTDASFKTYGRPLAWPHPYRLEAGAGIEHTVTLEVRGSPPPIEGAPAETPSERRWLRRPGIGFTLPGPIPSPVRDRVRALRPVHVRVETTPAALATTLEWAGAEARFLECPLMLAIWGAREPLDVSTLPSRSTVHLFDGEGNPASREMLAAWHRAGFTSIATGTLGNFVELNRKRAPADGAHTRIAFGINAQVHAGDDDSILETLTQHSAVARAAHRIGAGRPVVVAPISLGRRTDSVDPRVRTEFGARWLLESLKQLAEPGCVESVTYFHSHGPAGFVAQAGATPVERLLKMLAGRDTIPADFTISG